jgi:hypothetical protein
MTTLLDLVIGIGITVGGGLMLSGIYYLIRLTKRLCDTVEKHNRIFFGEDGCQNWRGVITIISETEERSMRNRQIIAELVRRLVAESILSKDDKIVVMLYDDDSKASS